MIIKGNTVGYPLADPRRGLAMLGTIHMNGQPLTGLKTPVSGSDAVTKMYADSLHKVFTVELPVSGWSDSAPYSQTATVDGMLSNDRPHYGVIYSAASQTALAEKEAFARVDDLDTADGSVTFTCFEEKPEAHLKIQLEVNRSAITIADGEVVMMCLEEGSGAAVQTEIEGVSYNVRNAGVNSTPAAGSYDFTIL